MVALSRTEAGSPSSSSSRRRRRLRLRPAEDGWPPPPAPPEESSPELGPPPSSREPPGGGGARPASSSKAPGGGGANARSSSRPGTCIISSSGNPPAASKTSASPPRGRVRESPAPPRPRGTSRVAAVRAPPSKEREGVAAEGSPEARVISNHPEPSPSSPRPGGAPARSARSRSAPTSAKGSDPSSGGTKVTWKMFPASASTVLSRAPPRRARPRRVPAGAATRWRSRLARSTSFSVSSTCVRCTSTTPCISTAESRSAIGTSGSRMSSQAWRTSSRRIARRPTLRPHPSSQHRPSGAFRPRTCCP